MGPTPRTQPFDPALSNEQWAYVLQLFAQLLDDTEPARVIASQDNESVRAALENLWRAHLHAQKMRFLEEQITVVSDLNRPSSSVFEPGQTLAGRFALLRLLGRGGMGEVYLADDQRLRETVAVKTIQRELAKDNDTRERFLAEIQNSRRVTHPNVCRIFDLFEHDGVPFYSMEYVAGPTLAEVLAGGSLDSERAKRLAIQTAEGLWAAHKNAILHCDFKPANILLAGSGKTERAVITDFGLARALAQADPVSRPQNIVGTLPYIAPEVLNGQPVSVRSDIYAFGKVLRAILPDSKLALQCAAEDVRHRPDSLEQVLTQLRSDTTRRNWLTAVLLAGAGGSVYVYEYFRPAIPLGSRQRVLVNGFKPDSGDTAKIVRNLLIIALRQSPLLSVVGDRSYPASGRRTVFNAGSALPLLDLLANSRENKVNLAIDGSVANVGPGLQLVLNVYDPVSSTPRYTSRLHVAGSLHFVQLAELAASDLRASAFGESSMRSTYVPLEQITSASPAAVDCYFRAVFAYEKSDATTALVLLDQAINTDPGFVLAHHYRALALMAQMRILNAQVSEEHAFAKRLRVSERERNWIESQYYNIVGAWVESAAALRKNTVLFPDEAVFQRQLAFALTRLGRYDEAISFNRRSIELDPFSDNNRSELLINLAEANRVDECMNEIQHLEASGQTPPLIDRDLAMVYMQTGDYERSLGECRHMGAAQASRDSLARLISIPPLVMMGRFSEAIEWIEGDLASDSARPLDDREDIQTNRRRNALGYLQRLTDQPSLAAEQAELLVNLQPVGANLVALREGCVLALDLNEINLAECALGALQQIAARWPSGHSQSAVWLTQAMLKEIQGQSGAAELYAEVKGTWPDPINLFYIARFEGSTNLPENQLTTLAELERLRGKVYKHHFAGLVVLGWIEQARCLGALSRFDDALRMYGRVMKHWGGSQTANTSLIRQVHLEMTELKRRVL